ncbi:MAG TPA: hypothetical protein VGG03_25155 [Thermoanaerobaculia bacterium]
MVPLRIRAVVFRDGDWWVIQGLDYDFVTLARSLEGVPGEIQRWLSVLFAASHHLGVEPFHGYSPAPRRFWKMYEQAEPWTELIPPVELPEDLGSTPVVDTRLAA